MAQFDVHRNPGRLRDVVPFLVLLQSARFDRSSHRVAAPLIARHAFPDPEPHFNPDFVIDGVAVVLDPLQIAAVPVARLGALAGSLAERSDDLIRALDLLISRGHG